MTRASFRSSARRISSAISTSWCCRRCSRSSANSTASAIPQLGLALTAFNITTALCQTPAGFLVDRIGARSVLVAGLVLGAVVPRDRRAGSVVLAAGRDVRAARRRQRRLSPGRLRDPVAARLERAREPGLLAAHLRGLPRHRGDAGHDADPAAGARLAGRVPRRLGDGPAGRDRVPAAAGRAVRAAAEAGAPAERAAEGRQGRLVAAAVGADPAQSAVLRDDHLLDHRRAELFGGRARRSLRHADRHRQHGADREPDAQRVRRARRRAACGARRRGTNGSRPARSSASR